MVSRGLREGSQKGSSPRKGCESKGRYSLFLRKRKKIRKKNQYKGVLRVIGAPGALRSQKRGPTQSQGAQVGQQYQIAVLKKGRKK
jgi:hypothetical protein